MKNPFGDNVRIVDRRKVNFHDIDRHVEMQPGDPITKTIAKLPLDKIKTVLDAAEAKGDVATAHRARAAADLRRSGVPPELTGPGQLHEVTSFDPRTGRAQTEYFGDSKVWRDKFTAPGVKFKPVHPSAFENRKTTVEHTAGQRVVVMGADGKVVREI